MIRAIAFFLSAGAVGACISRNVYYDVACYSGGGIVWKGQAHALQISKSAWRFKDTNNVPHVFSGAECYASEARVPIVRNEVEVPRPEVVEDNQGPGENPPDTHLEGTR